MNQVMTVACHPLDCRTYASDQLWNDASYALGQTVVGWRYVPMDDTIRAELARELGTDLPTSPGEYAERTLSKDLRGGGGACAMVVGRDIYARKHHSRVEAGNIVRELGPMERVGSIDLYSDGLQVSIYSHTYPRVFARSDHSGAQDYALSLLS